MASLQEIRQQYPQYSDMSDQQLADALHKKFYSDMPKGQFYSRIGLTIEDRAERQGFTPKREEKTYRAGGLQGVWVVDVKTSDLPMAERFMRGIADIPAGGAQLLTHALPDAAVNAINDATQYVNDLPYIGPVTKFLGMVPATREQIDRDVAQSNTQYEAQRNIAGGGGFDVPRVLGNIAATAPVAAALPAAGGGIASGAAAGALSGATTSALMPVTDPNADYWSEKGKQVGVGAAAGGVMGAAIPAVASMISPNVRPDVQTLMDRGVTPTPGQIMGGTWTKAEDKLTSVPLFGSMVSRGQQRAMNEFNSAVYDDVLAPIGKRVQAEPGRDAVAAVEQAIGDEYGRILPQVTFQVDQQLAADIGNLRQMAAQGLPPPQAARFDQIYRNDVLHRLQGSGTMDGQSFKELESQLGKLATGYRGSGEADQRLLGDALFELRNTLRQSLERTNPAQAPELQAANEAWARFVRLQKAAGSVGQDNPGIFTPAQLQSAVKSADRSIRKGAFARGDAMMQDLSDAGRAVLGSKYPNSGTPGRLGLMGLAAGAGYVEPTTALLSGALTLPYTSMGQRLAAALLTQRPQGAADLSAGLLALSPALRQAVVSGLLGFKPGVSGNAP